MALLERVAALVRANLNDLIDRAEEPEKMLKQVILDMQNQLLQVKTQVAIALADQHLLAKKAAENEQRQAEWMRKAELAVDRHDDPLARGALERAMAYRELAESFHQQVADQKSEVETLKGALGKLDQKIAEARSRSELLMARHRRARAGRKAGEASLALSSGDSASRLQRMKEKVDREEALNVAYREVSGETLEDRFAAIEKEAQIEKLLTELKSSRQIGPAPDVAVEAVGSTGSSEDRDERRSSKERA
jgi:phage shock protein A